MAQASASHPKDRVNLYQQITERIIAELEAGRVPWVQPWGTAQTAIGMPYNAVSQRRYSGVNVLSLWDATVSRGVAGHAFLTFRQAQALGGTVRRGERGVGIIYTHRFVPGEERRRAEVEGRNPVGSIPFLKSFTVFSVDQCDGLPTHIVAPPPPIAEGLVLPQVEALIAASGADFRIGGAMAYYSPSHDYVRVPRPDAYFEPINWHRTALHEMSHWGGGAARLGRDQSGAFGSREYGYEELIAEISSAYCCSSLGISPTVRHADFIGSWLEIIKENTRAILRAASAASRCADYLLSFLPEQVAANDDEDDPDGDPAMAMGGGSAA